MWFRSTTAFAQPKRRSSRAKHTVDRRQQARRLFFEGLEGRSLLAFDVLAEYGTGTGPWDVTLANVNGDAQPDMVVGNLNGNSIDVRLGNADGTFGAAQTSPTGAGPRSVATGDFTGDGIPDVVTANSLDVSLLVGNGDGTFQAPQSMALPGQVAPGDPSATPLAQRPSSIATGDLDADGKLDVVVGADTYFTQRSCYTGYYGGYYCNYFTTQDGYVNVLLGNGAGGFGPAETPHLGTSRLPADIAVGNVNGDTHADVITANNGGLSVLLGDGTGALGSPGHSGSGAALNSISLGDVDGDGKVDTLLTSGSGLYVQKGDGLGGFTAQPHVSTGNTVNSAVMGDVNADGKLDLVAAGASNVFTCTSGGYYGCYSGYYTTTRQVTVLLGNGLGSFALPLTSPLGSEMGIGYLADVSVADLTGDGLPDLATIDYHAGKSIIATNDGDWNPPPAISISDAQIVVEGDSGTVNAVFTVTIFGDHDGVSVGFSTSNSSATAGSDYTASSGTLTFEAGETSQTISVPILNDTFDEYDEQFVVSLSNIGGGLVFTDSQGVGTIEDDDAAPLVTINNASRNEGNQRQNTSLAFTVSLSAASGKWVSVNFATADGSATVAGSDYFAWSGTVSIAPGQTTGTLGVTVRGDKSREPNETFFVNLTGATDGTISDAQGVGTIVNDDGGRGKPPKVRIGDASLIEGSSGDEVLEFTVSLSEASEEAVSVAFATTDGRAKASDNDYVPISGRLDFAPGERTKTISVTINGDSKREDDESFDVDLSDAVGAEISDSRGRGKILNDDRRGGRGDD